MNYYVVVEGVTELAVYDYWIKYVNSKLERASYLSDVGSNNYFLVSGRGYPNYFRVIGHAIEDIKNDPNLGTLVVGIDSEDMSQNEKYEEVKNYIESKSSSIPYDIVVQHFCIETWALGNKAIFTRAPHSTELKECIALCDVSITDPEMLPENKDLELNRAQFAGHYFRLLLREKFRNLTYTKSNPEPLLHEKFIERVIRRSQEGHIQSLNTFLEAFK